MLPLGQAAQRVLDDDDRPVDDQTEVEGAEAHEVPGRAGCVHPDCHQQEGQRDDERGDDCRADVAEQPEQNGDDQQGTDQQILFHRADRRIDELRAVQHRVHHDARRQRAREFFEAFAHRSGDGPAVAAGTHEGGADDDLLPVFGCSARAEVAADTDVSDVTDSDGHSGPRRHGRAGDLVECADAPIGANQESFPASLVEVRADGHVRPFERLGKLGEGDSQRCHPRWIRLNHILLLIAADGIHPGDALDGRQLRSQDPVLDGAKVGELGGLIGEPLTLGREVTPIRLRSGPSGDPGHITGSCGRILDDIHEDLAEPCRDRSHAGFDALRQAFGRSGKALRNLLPGEIQVRAVLEDGGDLGEAVARD